MANENTVSEFKNQPFGRSDVGYRIPIKNGDD